MPDFVLTVPVGSWHPRLPDCLASLDAQSVALKVALFDASGDPRVEALAERYGHLLGYRHHGTDDGQADAIARGWDALDGEILGWLNADDVLAPGALAAAARYLDSPERPDLVFGESQIVNDAGQVTGFHWNVKPAGDRLLTECSISQPSCFFRREAVDSVGGLDRTLQFTMDWDLWVRLFRNDARFVKSDAVWSQVLWSRSAKTGGFGRGRRRELQRIIAQSASLKARLAAYLGYASHHLYEYGLPRQLRNRIRSHDTIGGEGKFGWHVGGAVSEITHIPLFHYDPQPKTLLRLETPAAADNWHVQIDGADVALCAAEPGWLVAALPERLLAGQCVQVALAPMDKRAITLLGLELA